MSKLKRKDALNIIRIDAAQHGKATTPGIRAYIENNVSQAAFLEAVRLGQAIYERGQRATT